MDTDCSKNSYMCTATWAAGEQQTKYPFRSLFVCLFYAVDALWNLTKVMMWNVIVDDPDEPFPGDEIINIVSINQLLLNPNCLIAI